MFERETKREKLLEARHKEMKLKKRVKSGGGDVSLIKQSILDSHSYIITNCNTKQRKTSLYPFDDSMSESQHSKYASSERQSSGAKFDRSMSIARTDDRRQSLMQHSKAPEVIAL